MERCGEAQLPRVPRFPPGGGAPWRRLPESAAAGGAGGARKRRLPAPRQRERRGEPRPGHGFSRARWYAPGSCRTPPLPCFRGGQNTCASRGFMALGCADWPSPPAPLPRAGEGRPEPRAGASQCGRSRIGSDVLFAPKPFLAGGENRAPPPSGGRPGEGQNAAKVRSLRTIAWTITAMSLANARIAPRARIESFLDRTGANGPVRPWRNMEP